MGVLDIGLSDGLGLFLVKDVFVLTHIVKKYYYCSPASTIHVTSFSSISYWSNSEHWTQKGTQSDSIHSIILNVIVIKTFEHQNKTF